VESSRHDVHVEWDRAADREKRARTVFAQESLKPDEVAPELEAARAAVGGQEIVREFVPRAVARHGGAVARKGEAMRLHLGETPRALRDRLSAGDISDLDMAFDLPTPEGALYVTRTHPFVEGLAGFIVDTSLDPLLDGAGRRSGAIRTDAVKTRTTLLLLRLRHHLSARRKEGEQTLLAEECHVAAFEGAPAAANWLGDERARALLAAVPKANLDGAMASDLVRRVTEGFGHLAPHLEAIARGRAEAVREAHRRVRTAARLRGQAIDVTPMLPVDVLGVFVLMPAV